MRKHLALIELGRHIRGMREERGYSQDGFALHAGLDRTYYAGIERGERNVAALNLIKIAFAMGVEPGTLFPDGIALKVKGSG